MSYIRWGEDLICFRGESAEYVYPTNAGIDDNSASFRNPETLADLMVRMVLRETGDREFAQKMAGVLADHLGITDKLLPKCNFAAYDVQPLKK